MPWRKPSESLGALLGELAAEKPGTEPRKMFGCPCWFVGGNMFAGVHESTMILRLSEDDRAAAAKKFDGCGPFTPMENRPMREYVAVPERSIASKRAVAPWVDKAHAFASSLPPKASKRVTKKAAAKKQPRPR
jgi:TfoX/Sxy family transcriptional regulator of competence genes